MDQDTRNKLQRATQQVRRILEEEFAEQLEGTFDVLADGTIAAEPGKHLDARQRLTRKKLVQAIAHIESGGETTRAAIAGYLRHAAFTILNRFVALRMLEARELLQECISKGEESSGFNEFCGLAPGLSVLPDDGYRLYLECLCDELSVEINVLFDRRDPTTLLWPRRSAMKAMLDVLAQPELASVWAEDETIGWVYQYFNGDEERTQMRKESQAPRNSRELAVRNQFFTPRYVVQFLTDNTLGRTWYEMMQGKTKLAHLTYLVRRPNEVFLAEDESAPEPDTDDSELNREELLQQTVHVPFRAKKDPRDMRILDPACGSGHFLLYAFELLVSIYEEGWSDSESAFFTETGSQLGADFGSLDDLRRAIPELILRHNLHGVDIDPRAAQIAALALWMRAQRAYNQFEVDRAQRPLITKTNIVVAEPMPGDAELVEEFAASLKPAVLGDLFKKMVEEMKLAGELGSLLKIEESIVKAVKDAEEVHRKEGLFAEKIESLDFWGTADGKIIAALKRFAVSAAGSTGTRRQLFAGDAAQGVAFVELMRQRFDVVLMNPPFGAGSKQGKLEFEKSYARTKNDVYAAFVERGIGLLHAHGRLGAITSRTGFFLGSFQKWREETILGGAPPSVFADLGHGVMDTAMVEAAAYCLEKGRKSETVSIFIRALWTSDKAGLLTSAIGSLVQHDERDRFEVAPKSFGSLPSSPFAYWTPFSVLQVFQMHAPFDAAKDRASTKGMSTDDDFRFVRARWEVPQDELGRSWPVYVNGGKRSPFYGDTNTVVNWRHSGSEVKASVEHKWGNAGKSIRNERLFYQPGLSWPLRGARFSARAIPRGCIFSGGGKMAFAPEDEISAMLAIFNSSVFNALLNLFAGKVGGVQYEAGLIGGIPVPQLSEEQAVELSNLGRKGYQLALARVAAEETCIGFALPDIARRSGTLSNGSATTESRLQKIEVELEEISSEIDGICIRLYGINDHDMALINREFSDTASSTGRDGDSAVHVERDRQSKELGTALRVHGLLSWVVGVSVGRFDIGLCTRDEPAPNDVEPFGLRRLFSLGTLLGDDALPPSAPLPEFRVAFPADGIFVDDQGHSADLIGRSRAIFNETFDEPEARWQEAAELGGTRNQDLRLWFAKEFFPYHIKQYSKSRRKAPIYWQIATPSASYSVWLYYHCFTRDTFFKVLNEYVKPKLNHERQKLERVRNEGGADPTRSQRKEIEDQDKFVSELAAMAEEVERIAPLWNPNLNDGAIINFAPLWRLVPQHKVWQKECKKVWDKLVKGEYDWAHLAMHLWPERVVPKCVMDASFAIAHGLEEVFWEQDDRDRYQPKEEPEGGWDPVIKELVDERTSPAVKAALESLLTAPAPAGNSKSRRRKATT